MKSFVDYVKETDNEICFEMSSFKKDKSGLPVNLWIDDAGNDRNKELPHNIIRLKMQNNTDSHLDKDNLIPIKIDKYNPEILLKKGKYQLGIKETQLKDVFNFIIEWYDELVQVYEQKLDIDDFKEMVKNNKKSHKRN